MARPSDTDEAAARAARAQGRGACYDAPVAPTHDLLLARRGIACFARELNELSGAELDGSSLCGAGRAACGFDVD